MLRKKTKEEANLYTPPLDLHIKINTASKAN